MTVNYQSTLDALRSDLDTVEHEATRLRQAVKALQAVIEPKQAKPRAKRHTATGDVPEEFAALNNADRVLLVMRRDPDRRWQVKDLGRETHIASVDSLNSALRRLRDTGDLVHHRDEQRWSAATDTAIS